ncbi:MAG: hypothetical protein H6709_07790 [Kofleriaceae bacterium]|nr:hypothetical protein [Kofleriaceae bacterium]
MTTTKPRRRWGRLLVLVALVAAIVLALLYLRCRGGFGLGGGSDSGSGKAKQAVDVPAAPTAAAGVDAGAPRCQVRLDAEGLTLDGARAEPAAVVAACKAAGAADVVVTGAARFGAWEQLRDQLAAEGVETFVRGAPQAAP